AYCVEKQLLCALVTRRDFQRGQRFFLGFDLLPREQVTLAEIAVRGRLVGGAGLQRGPEFTGGRRRVTALERETPPAAVRRRVERVERDDAREREGLHCLVAGAPRDVFQLPRRFHVGVVGIEQQLIFLHRTSLVAKFLGELRHQGVRALGPDRAGDEHRRALQRREARRVA